VYVGLVPDTNLDVGLAAEPRVRVDVFALREDAANGIEGFLAGFLSREMEEVDNGAVELAEKKVIAADVLRHLGARGGNDRLKTCVCLLHGVDSIGADEVQAKSGIDHGAADEGLDVPGLFFHDSICAVLSPFQGSVGV
jgi:hypothetical protein